MKDAIYPDALLERVEIHHAAVTEMVYGVIRRYRSLEWIIARYAQKKPSLLTRVCLELGIYQLIWMNQEEYAVVNETVELAKQRCGGKVYSFVNAVLRNVTREKDTLLKDLDKESLAIRFSHPDILVERWSKRFGVDAAEKLCRWNNRPPDIILRINTNITTVDAYLTLIAQDGVDARPHQFAPESSVVLPRGCRAGSLPGYVDGLFSVQDPAAGMAVRMLNPQPGEKILDACAAPGGKTLYIAEKMKGEGVLVAADAQKARLPRLRENIARAGHDFIQIVHGSAAVSELYSGEMFDKILLDLPCSNTGVLRRRPDARWRFTREYSARIRAVQRKILVEAGRHLAPGGIIVYSTCSLEEDENNEQVQSWIMENPDFQLIKECQLTPQEHEVDGAYVAVLGRRV